MKWTDIENTEDGLSVRNKLNNALEYAINPPTVDVNNVNYAINGETDKIILVTTGNSDRIITLPELSGTDYEDNIFTIMKIDSGTGRVIINGYGTDTIMGNSSVTVRFQWENYKLQKHGSLWIPHF